MRWHHSLRLMRTDCHLILQSVVLSPAEEWLPPTQGWVIARLAEGVGYWMHGGQARELKEGDGFVVSGQQNMVLRASRLGVLKLELYLLQPQLLNGLLTVTEENRLEQVAGGLQVPVVFFTAADALGQKFSRLAHQAWPESLPSRAALVQFWAQAVVGLLPRPAADTGGNKLELQQRFRQLVAKLPDAELSRLSLSQLAGMLGCSEQHFRRLFLQEFGVSLRARQTESRLRRASQLLADTGDTISNIAFESGYHHRGLFNAMFKKRFGLTPSAWRQRSVSPFSAASKNLPPDAGAGMTPGSSGDTRWEMRGEKAANATTKKL